MDGFATVLERLQLAMDELGRALVLRLPELLGAVALILVGWLVAGWLRKLTRALGARLNRELDRVLRPDRAQRVRVSPALVRLFSNLVFWIVLLGFATAAAAIADFELLSGWLERVIAWLPHLLLGVLIIATGYLIAAIVRDLVLDALDSAGVEQRALIGRLAQVATFLAAIVIGIDQIGIDVSFVTTMIAVVLGVVLAGFSLAFGLGARQLVSDLIAADSLRRHFRVGHRARIGGVEGEILELSSTSVVIATAEGRAIVPASRFAEETTVILMPGPDRA
jgi:small-conductance mechanosensitive channel